MILVDAGFPGQLSQIRQAVTNAGALFEKIDKIVITHHDRDHLGSVRRIISVLPQGVSVLAIKKKNHILRDKSYLVRLVWPMLWTVPILRR